MGCRAADINRNLLLRIPVRSEPIKPYMILKEHIEKNLKLAKPIELLRW